MNEVVLLQLIDGDNDYKDSVIIKISKMISDGRITNNLVSADPKRAVDLAVDALNSEITKIAEEKVVSVPKPLSFRLDEDGYLVDQLGTAVRVRFAQGAAEIDDSDMDSYLTRQTLNLTLTNGVLTDASGNPVRVASADSIDGNSTDDFLLRSEMPDLSEYVVQGDLNLVNNNGVLTDNNGDPVRGSGEEFTNTLKEKLENIDTSLYLTQTELNIVNDNGVLKDIAGNVLSTPFEGEVFTVDLKDKLEGLDPDSTDVTYSNATPTPEQIGGIPAGSTFTGVSHTDLMDMILYPYQKPAFTNFDINVGAKTIEVGNTITSGAKTFTWTISNSSNLVTSSIKIEDVTNSDIYGSGLTNDGIENLIVPSNITRTSPGTNTWRITGQNSNSESFIRDVSVSWRWMVYYGVTSGTDINELIVEGLASRVLATGYSGTKSFNGAGYKIIAYPTSMGRASNFVDTSTGFAVPMDPPVTLSVTNEFGVSTNYYVYRTVNSITGNITMEIN